MFPGIHGFPMSQRQLVHTRELGRALQVIHALVEPFSISWARTPARADIRITGVQLEKLKLFGVDHGAPVLVSSRPLHSHYIVVPVRGDVQGTIAGRAWHATPGEALVYAAGTCLDAHWGEHCVALVLAVGRETLLEAARRHVPALHAIPALLPKMSLGHGAGRSFANLLGCLCAENDSLRDGDHSPAIRAGLQDLLLTALVNMNAHLWPRGFERATSRRRRGGVARAVDYLQQHPHRAVTAGELARVACLSLRSLQIGFAECFAVGPMTYARRLRLARAREELTGGDPRDVQLANLAARWGFPSPGAFSRLYRQHFGELPSQTLKTARRTLRRAGVDALELTG
jgi:AraC-like DNA-binding protein